MVRSCVQLVRLRCTAVHRERLDVRDRGGLFAGLAEPDSFSGHQGRSGARVRVVVGRYGFLDGGRCLLRQCAPKHEGSAEQQQSAGRARKWEKKKMSWKINSYSRMNKFCRLSNDPTVLASGAEGD